MKLLKLLLLSSALMLGSTTLVAQEQAAEKTPPSEEEITQETINTLTGFVELQRNLLKEIKQLNKQIKSAQTDAEKNSLKEQLTKLESDLRSTNQNFEKIAAGVDISLLKEQKEEVFDFQKEVFALVRPAIDEMKEMTARVRKKSELKEKIADYKERLPVVEAALANIEKLAKGQNNKALKKSFKETADGWKQQQAFMKSELQAAELQLDKLIKAETSLAAASQSYLKSFFQKRGLYLIEALGIVLLVLFLSRLSHRAMYRLIPGFRKPHRSFRLRLLELLHRIFTMLFTILGPMLIFYLAEDWVLFSLGLLLLIGIAWTLRQTLPRYWRQIQLFLNIGSVREGERLTWEGIPWKVEKINMHSILTNPMAGISQRVPIEELVDLKSRPYSADEPWFPCQQGDWVILADGVRGKVTGISHELVQLIARGGTRLTYLTSDFLAQSPRNLSGNFRIKETVGISYRHQKQSTQEIPEQLHTYLHNRLVEEGYKEQLLNLKVEFAQASASSLDLVVIADFDGSVGDLYNRLRRAIQRWSVDACTEHDWEIPFPQMTIHKAKDG